MKLAVVRGPLHNLLPFDLGTYPENTFGHVLGILWRHDTSIILIGAVLQ